MQATIDEAKKTLTIVMPLETPRASGSGKSIVIASTGAPKATTAMFGGKPVTIGVNAYVKAA